MAQCDAADTAGFSAEVDQVWVVLPNQADPEMEAAAAGVVTALRERYGSAAVAPIRHLSPNAVAIPGERRVVIDDELAVPGQPQWFAHYPTTVFVHWTTATEDIGTLIRDGQAAACGSIVPAGLTAVWDLAEKDSVVLIGYTDATSFDVVLPAGWAVLDVGTLVAEVVASDIAREDMSLRFDLDDRPAATWTLADDTDVRLPVPSAHFTDEGFVLRALTTTPIVEENECSDPRHVGRWVDLGRPQVQALIAPRDVDVARAIAGLGPVSVLTGRPLRVSLPANPSPAVLEALGATAAAIGHHGAPAGWEVVTGELDAGSGIVIAPDAGQPAAISVAVHGLDVVLSLTGEESGFVKLAEALNDSNRALFFHGTTITAADVPDATPPSNDDVVVFADAGYGDRTIRGSGSKSLVYSVHIPAGVPPDSATLALYGTYAPALADYESVVSVRINGNEDEIVTVLDPSGQLQVLHTITPANLRPGLNFVTVTVQMGDQGGGQCSSGESRWLTIAATSALGVDTNQDPQQVRLGVEDVRFALAAGADFGETDIVMADEPTNDEIAAALRLVAKLANRSDGGAPHLVTDASADRSKHLVIVGPVDGRELLHSIPYAETGAPVGVIAAIPSPYATGRVLIAFTGGTAEATELAIDAGLSAAVNDIAKPYALVSIDEVRAVGDSTIAGPVPPELAYADGEQVAAPVATDYDQWVLDQAARIQAANAPATDLRRTVAVGLLLVIGSGSGLLWIRRSRKGHVAGAGH